MKKGKKREGRRRTTHISRNRNRKMGQQEKSKEKKGGAPTHKRPDNGNLMFLNSHKDLKVDTA